MKTRRLGKLSGRRSCGQKTCWEETVCEFDSALSPWSWFRNAAPSRLLRLDRQREEPPFNDDRLLLDSSAGYVQVARGWP